MLIRAIAPKEQAVITVGEKINPRLQVKSAKEYVEQKRNNKI
jgi:hypothetical protein